jgi:hypothetical protein
VQLDGVVPRVAAEQAGSAGIRAKQAQEYPDCRGLAGSVWTEETVHLAGNDR